MTLLRSNAFTRSFLYRCAATTIVSALLATTVFGQRGSGDRTVLPDYLATVNPQLFSGPPTPTTLTRFWANTMLAAMGSPEKLANLARVHFYCELTGSFGTMALTIEANSRGETTFKQVLQSNEKGAPPRTISFSINSANERVVIGDGESENAAQIPPDALSALRRAGDMWNPVFTMMGQFERVESTTLTVLDGRSCTLLTLGTPRLPGLTSGKVWIDLATLLPVRYETNVLRDVPITGVSRITEWQLNSGIQIPRTILIDGPEGTSTLTFLKVGLFSTTGPL